MRSENVYDPDRAVLRTEPVKPEPDTTTCVPAGPASGLNATVTGKTPAYSTCSGWEDGVVAVVVVVVGELVVVAVVVVELVATVDGPDDELDAGVELVEPHAATRTTQPVKARNTKRRLVLAAGDLVDLPPDIIGATGR